MRRRTCNTLSSRQGCCRSGKILILVSGTDNYDSPLCGALRKRASVKGEFAGRERAREPYKRNEYRTATRHTKRDTLAHMVRLPFHICQVIKEGLHTY